MSIHQNAPCFIIGRSNHIKGLTFNVNGFSNWIFNVFFNSDFIGVNSILCVNSEILQRCNFLYISRLCLCICFNLDDFLTNKNGFCFTYLVIFFITG